MRGSYSIMILPSDGSRVIMFKMGRWIIWTLLVLGAIVLVLLVGVSLSWDRLRARSERLKEVLAENRRLRATLERVNLIEKNLRDVTLYRNRLSLLLGYPVPPVPDLLPLGDSRPLANLPLVWPVEGWITTKPGQVGLKIFAQQGSPVRSTGDGVISFAGWKKDLGKALIIDHHNGYLTVYGHNSAILAPVGERVKRGAVIALSGGGPSPYLYYGVRRNGVEVDPRELLIR